MEKKVTIDNLEITTPDKYSVELNIIPEEIDETEVREYSNLGKKEVFELAVLLLDIYKNMEE